MTFQLFATGRTFDADGFLGATGFRCDHVFRCGERYGRGGWIRESSGFSRLIGDATLLSLEQQIDEAIRFLDENRDLLSRLGSWPGLDSATVALSPSFDVTRSVVCLRLLAVPLGLLRACADLGLEVGFAVRLRWANEPEEPAEPGVAPDRRPAS